MTESVASSTIDPTADRSAAELYQIGLKYFKEDRFAESAAAFERSLIFKLTEMTLFALAGSQWSLNAFRDCEVTLVRLLLMDSLSPGMEQMASLRLAKIRANRGDVSGAKAALFRSRQRHPGNPAILLAYTDLLAMTDAPEACAVLQQSLETPETDLAEASLILRVMTSYRVGDLRQSRALPRDAAQSWQDLLQWSDPDGLSALLNSLEKELVRPSMRIGALLELGIVSVAKQKWDRANFYFTHARVASPGTFADILHLSPPHFDALEKMTDAEITGNLAPVVRLITQEPGDMASLFLASDPVYFNQFTKPLLRSLESRGAKCHVTVHLLDGDKSTWRQAAADLAVFKNISISLSAEDSGARNTGKANARVYYHAVRFIRFYEELKRRQHPMWMIDVDVNVLHDPTPLLAGLRGYDVAVHGRASALDPWSKIVGCCIGAAPTDLGLAYARIVAAFIAHARREKTWMWAIDQVALFAAYVHMDRAGRLPATLFLGDDAICLNNSTTGVFQFASGMNKFSRAETA